MTDCNLSGEQVNTLKQKVSILEDDRNIPELLNCLSSETRIKVLVLLKSEKELSVCDMASVLGLSVSAVSHQLRCLRDLNLVRTRRDGQNIYYKLGENSFLQQLLKLI